MSLREAEALRSELNRRGLVLFIDTDSRLKVFGILSRFTPADERECTRLSGALREILESDRERISQ